jgi:hypothetical protein
MINTYVETAYVKAFYNLVKTTSEDQGYEIPADIESYVVFFLADYMKKQKFPPEKSFTITLNEIKQSGKIVPKSRILAEDCLFLTSFCPLYAKKHNINLKYYTGIGAASYYDYANAIRDDFFVKLGDLFEFIRDFVTVVLNSAPQNIDDLIWMAENGSHVARKKLPNNMIFLSSSYRNY